MKIEYDALIRVDNKDIRNGCVIIPDKIKIIGEFALYMRGLRRVSIPHGVVFIESNAFSNNNLTDINIPNSVRIIEKFAFAKNNLKKVTMSNKVKIQDGAFDKGTVINYV